MVEGTWMIWITKVFSATAAFTAPASSDRILA